MGIVICDNIAIQAREMKEIEDILVSFDKHGISIDKAILERALIGPLDLKRELVQFSESTNDHILPDSETPENKTSLGRKQRENLNMIKHSRSTNVFCINLDTSFKYDGS
jgi:hypothetical protein